MDTAPIGTIITQPVRDDIALGALGYLPMMGGGNLYPKALYPDLWAKIQGTEWVAEEVGPSFRLRDMSNQFVRGKGSLTEECGKVQEDGAPNIEGRARIRGTEARATGIIQTVDAIRGAFGGGFSGLIEHSFETRTAGGNNNTGQISGPRDLLYNASWSNPKYRPDVVEVRPTNVSVHYYIKASDAPITSDTETTVAEMKQFIAEALDKMQQLSNQFADSDFVVDSWQSANGQLWYRKYKSGWVEQGGTMLSTGATNQIVTFPRPMVNNTYQLNLSIIGRVNEIDTSAIWVRLSNVNARTNTTISVITGFANSAVNGSSTATYSWLVAGYAQ